MVGLSGKPFRRLFAILFVVLRPVADSASVPSISLSLTRAASPVEKRRSFLETRELNQRPSESLRYETRLFTATLKMSDGSNLDVLVDTGSGDFVVASSACDTAGCGKHRRFQPALDSHGHFLGTNAAEIHLSYATGDVLGEGFEGQVCVAKTCGRMSFIVASWESVDFAHYKFDAVLGLGPKQLSFADGFNFITAFAHQGALQAPTFSLDLRNGDGNPTLSLGVPGAPPGAIAPGAKQSIASIAASIYSIGNSSVQWLPVAKDSSEWAVPMVDVVFGDVRLDVCGATDCRAVLDSGCGGIALPAKVAQRVKSTLHAGDCSALGDLPRLDFFIGGQKYAVGPERYMKVSEANASHCWPLIYEQPKDVVGMAVLGLPFLLGRRTTFDAGSMMVGFG